MVQRNKSKKTICPQCGYLIDSFTGRCQACGTELYDLEPSKSVKEFSENIAKVSILQQKIDLIKTYPIPNTREDIMEYLILASSNIGYRSETVIINEQMEEYETAWVTKFIQGYQKAKLVYETGEDFNNIQKLYENTMMRLDNAEKERKIRRISRLGLKNIGVIAGTMALFIAIGMNLAGENSSLMELIAILLLIIAACTLRKRETEYIEYGISILSGFLPIVCSFALDNGSMFELGGAVVLIIVVANFFKNLGENRIK